MPIDFDSLAEEFGLSNTVLENTQVIETGVETHPVSIELKPSNINEPDKLVAINISKANAILDHVIGQIEDGNGGPRMIEVAGQLINAINGSTTQLYQKIFNNATIRLKIESLRLKERQLGLLEKSGGPGNTNIIITDRESILKIINSNNQEKIENNKAIDI